MIIKSMSRKSKTFGQLLQYLVAPGVTQIGPPWLHNLRARDGDLDDIRREFFQNSGHLPQRKNGNVLYHEILSFAAEDQEHITLPMLEDLARFYMERRAPYALGYARTHLNTDCPHIHVVISANNFGSSRRLRLSQAEFARIQREVEQYQQERYPQVTHSIAQGRQRADRQRLRQTRGERESQRRGAGQTSRKESVAAVVRSELALAASGAECFRRLLEQRLRLYKRGKSVGVEDLDGGRRYRLKTLGLAAVFANAQRGWERAEETVVRSRDLPSDQHQRLEKGLGLGR